MKLPPGTRLGSYEITAKLGEGGMGVVYRARDTRLDRDVAIKVLPAAFVEDHDRLARFEREAKVLAQLNHPNIAAIHGLEESGGVRALVMELVEGPTLAELFESGPLPVEESLALAHQIAEALEEAHDKGIIHRDLKPQNIKASREGKVKVLDFGLAKALDPAGASGIASASQLAQSPTLTLGVTVQGVILGTAAYMSPEQAKGLAVDKRADIWAFGVVLYEMLTGRRLFSGDTVPEVLAGVLKSEIDLGALPTDVPPAIRRLVRRCLERRPQDRLRDIGDARIVLGETIAGGTEAAAPRADTTPAARSIRLSLAAGVAIALAVTGYLAGRRGREVASESIAAVGSASFQKLTFQPGEEINPALSPDGRTLYFVEAGRWGEDSDIYFVPVGGRKPINLTADSRVDDYSPAISPDGRQIAFASERDGGGIFLMGTTGESVRRLTHGCFEPAWSPDGRRIACTTCSGDDPFSRGCQGELRVVDVATGASHNIDTVDTAAPTWSPDGRRIAFWGVSGDESGWRDLRTVDVDGGSPVALTHDAAVDWNPVWSDDGRSVYFLSDRGGAPNLWRLAIDPGSGAPRGAPESVVLPTEFASEIRRGGGRWAYVSRSLRSTIERFAFDPVRAKMTRSEQPVLEITSRLQAMSLSPDGRRLAYTAVLPRQDLFVVDIGGGTPVQLTDDLALDRFPSWDPRGERILFMSNRSGRYEIWSIGADGSGLEQLTRTTDESRWGPQLSPNGDRLSVISQFGTSIFDASGSPPWERFERLPNPESSPPEKFEALAWSRDGTRLTGFVRGVATPPNVAYYSFTERQLHVFDAGGVGLAWLPSGRGILVSGFLQPQLLDLATGETRAVESDVVLRGPGVSVSPDLGTVVTFENREEADIWLAEGIE